MILLRESIIEKMHKTVERKNEVIIKLSLKLITELLRDNKVKEAALPDFKYNFIDRLFNLISEVIGIINFERLAKNNFLFFCFKV